ncbi:hypothetical protein K503DRAFT_770915 [Rhizopogon vinicolor AM-OR11-026]|uniref:Uncharacterized protein n=1 Tax=Rhizopogon vinicolor AM-OR11-026 TaxID=1314800 RepID=A0A1B7MZG0_9AGAM|nr:hypothetical protein K503DRAFT_770915 [Rhizopogon vinicolor AM-OR11-026]
MSTAVLAGIATADAPDPNGGPCAHANQPECGVLAGFNNGNAFLFYCYANHSLLVSETCTCPTCCSISYGSTGPDGFTCT